MESLCLGPLPAMAVISAKTVKILLPDRADSTGTRSQAPTVVGKNINRLLLQTTHSCIKSTILIRRHRWLKELINTSLLNTNDIICWLSNTLLYTQPSSPDTLSLTLSEVEACGLDRLASPDHLVSRRSVLERIGINADAASVVSHVSHNRSHASFRYIFRKC